MFKDGEVYKFLLSHYLCVLTYYPDVFYIYQVWYTIKKYSLCKLVGDYNKSSHSGWNIVSGY